jgi:hypothetical protein
MNENRRRFQFKLRTLLIGVAALGTAAFVALIIQYLVIASRGRSAATSDSTSPPPGERANPPTTFQMRHDPVIAELTETPPAIPLAHLTPEFVRDTVDLTPPESQNRIAGTFIGTHVSWDGRLYASDTYSEHSTSLLICDRYASFSTIVDLSKFAFLLHEKYGPMLHVEGVIESIGSVIIRLKDATIGLQAEDYGHPSEYQLLSYPAEP